MQELLAVALGGSIGAVSRYLVTNYIFIRWHCHWPWATFIVNAAGCLAMGFLMVLITEKGLLTPYWRLLLCVGFLGGLTTFSSFSYESLTLLSEGNLAGAGLNIIGSVAVNGEVEDFAFGLFDCVLQIGFALLYLVNQGKPFFY